MVSIYIPPRIPLNGVWRVDGAWVLLTRAPRGVSDPLTCVGEKIVLYDDGSAERHVVRPDGDDMSSILPSDKERKE